MLVPHFVVGLGGFTALGLTSLARRVLAPSVATPGQRSAGRFGLRQNPSPAPRGDWLPRPRPTLKTRVHTLAGAVVLAGSSGFATSSSGTGSSPPRRPASPRFLGSSRRVAARRRWSQTSEDVAPELSSAATLGLVLIGPVMAPGSWGTSSDGAITGPSLGLSSEEQWLAQGLMPLLDSLLLVLNPVQPAFLGYSPGIGSGPVWRGLGRSGKGPTPLPAGGFPLHQSCVRSLRCGSWFLACS